MGEKAPCKDQDDVGHDEGSFPWRTDVKEMTALPALIRPRDRDIPAKGILRDMEERPEERPEKKLAKDQREREAAGQDEFRRHPGIGEEPELTEDEKIAERHGKAIGGRWCESIRHIKRYFSFFSKF